MCMKNHKKYDLLLVENIKTFMIDKILLSFSQAHSKKHTFSISSVRRAFLLQIYIYWMSHLPYSSPHLRNKYSNRSETESSNPSVQEP